MEAVLVALIVAGVSILGQWLLKRQDYRRQDEVATRLVEAGQTLELVHKIVNQHQTDMRAYQDLLVRTLRTHGVDIPKDESIS